MNYRNENYYNSFTHSLGKTNDRIALLINFGYKRVDIPTDPLKDTCK